MKKLFFATFLLLNTINCLWAQTSLGKMYKPSQVKITEDGITMYEKWNVFLGDSIRKNNDGTPVEGWMEDLYENGQILHSGFYVQGRLHSYKNIFMDGTEERVFTKLGAENSNMKTYCANGKLRSDIDYFKRIPIKTKEYYSNGHIKLSQAYDKSGSYLLYKKSFFEDKKPKENIVLIDPTEKKYDNKVFYDNGELKVDGEMKFDSTAKSFNKTASWKVFDEKGAPLEDKSINTTDAPTATTTLNNTSNAINASDVPATKNSIAATDANTTNTNVSNNVTNNNSIDNSIATTTSSANQAKTKKILPPEFKPADINNDDMITPNEITSAIDAFFDGDTRFTTEKINGLIDFFFQE